MASDCFSDGIFVLLCFPEAEGGVRGGRRALDLEGRLLEVNVGRESNPGDP